MKFLEAALARALGEPSIRLERTEPLSGGSVHAALRLITSHGEFFAKWSRAGPEDIFLREAFGLEALRAVGADLVIPRVIAAAGRASMTRAA